MDDALLVDVDEAFHDLVEQPPRPTHVLVQTRVDARPQRALLTELHLTNAGVTQVMEGQFKVKSSSHYMYNDIVPCYSWESPEMK